MDGGVPYFTDRVQRTELRRQGEYSLFWDWFRRFTPLTPSSQGWLNPRQRGCQCGIGFSCGLRWGIVGPGGFLPAKNLLKALGAA